MYCAKRPLPRPSVQEASTRAGPSSVTSGERFGGNHLAAIPGRSGSARDDVETCASPARCEVARVHANTAGRTATVAACRAARGGVDHVAPVGPASMPAVPIVESPAVRPSIRPSPARPATSKALVTARAAVPPDEGMMRRSQVEPGGPGAPSTSIAQHRSALSHPCDGCSGPAPGLAIESGRQHGGYEVRRVRFQVPHRDRRATRRGRQAARGSLPFQPVIRRRPEPAHRAQARAEVLAAIASRTCSASLWPKVARVGAS